MSNVIPLPPELETLNAAQVAASFGRSRDWWSRVRLRYETELGFPRPLAPLADRRKGGEPSTPALIYNKEAVVMWHRRQAGGFNPQTPPELEPNLAALERAS